MERLGRHVDHSSPSNAEVKSETGYTATQPTRYMLHGVDTADLFFIDIYDGQTYVHSKTHNSVEPKI